MTSTDASLAGTGTSATISILLDAIASKDLNHSSQHNLFTESTAARRRIFDALDLSNDRHHHGAWHHLLIREHQVTSSFAAIILSIALTSFEHHQLVR